MKKIIYFMAMALVGLLGMTSCDDDYAYPPVLMGDIKGTGTAEDPYNIAHAVRVAAANGEESTTPFFVRGYVVDGSIDTSYGNATWDLYDNPEGTGQKLIVYRCKGFNNQKFTDASQVKTGDVVVIYGPLINFRGNTPETGSGAYLISVNGTVGSDIPDQPQGPSVTIDPAGDGTTSSPYNVARAIEVAKANGESSETSVYTEGYVISGSIDTSYGNGTWEICDNAEGTASKITVYRAKDLGNQKFTDANKVKPGDKIVVYAPIINFKGNTPETNLGYLYSINGNTESGGSTPDTPDTPVTPGTGEGSETSPYSVSDVISGKTGTGVWVKGYIVGWVNGQVLSSGATFNANATVATNLLVADNADETNVEKCVPVQLPSGAVRTALNLQDNPGNYKKEVLLKGNLEKYFGTAGIKTVTEYRLDGAGTPDTPDTPQPSGDVVFSSLVNNADGWTFDNIKLADELTYVWKWDDSYKNLKASAYNQQAYEADAYAYTSVDLAACKTAALTFEHAYKFAADGPAVLSLVVREKGGSWTKLTIPSWPTGQDWTFVSSGAIDLSAYAGKAVEIGFRYVSSAAEAPTWEIKNLTVTATK